MAWVRAPVVPVPKNGSSTTSPGFASITAERGTRGSDRPPGNHRADAAAILGRFDGGRAGLLESCSSNADRGGGCLEARP